MLWTGLVHRDSVDGVGTTHAGAQRFCVVVASVCVRGPMGVPHA